MKIRNKANIEPAVAKAAGNQENPKRQQPALVNEKKKYIQTKTRASTCRRNTNTRANQKTTTPKAPAPLTPPLTSSSPPSQHSQHGALQRPPPQPNPSPSAP